MELQRVGIPVMSASIPWDNTPMTVCLEADFVSQLLGLGQILKYYRMWEGTDEEIQSMMANIERGLQALAGECCDEAIVSLRRGKNGYLMATNGAGDTTIIENAVSASEILSMPEEQALDNASDNVCAGVRFLAERYWADVDFALDQAALVVDETRTAVDGLSAILNSIPLFAQSAGILFDGWTEFIGQAVAVGISAAKLAFSDPAVRLAYSENLYCGILDNGNVLTQSIFFNAAEDLPLFETQSNLLAYFSKGFEIPELGTIFSTALRWYNMGALGEDPTCALEFDCEPGWILEADLTLSSAGLEVWTPFNGLGVYVPGVGFKPTTANIGGSYHRNIFLGADFPEATYTGAGMTFTYSQGVMIGSGTAEWYLAAGGEVYGVLPSNATPPNSPWDVTGAEAVGERAYFIIPVGLSESGDPGGDATMNKARLYGVGIPPTIEGWELV